MIKKIFLFLLPGCIIGSIYMGYRFYNGYKEDQRRAAYYENLTDTSSPTVTVLRDSIYIPYQDEKRTVHIYVPPSYTIDTTTQYPVIYLMDGESAFNDLENMGPEWQVDEVINSVDALGSQSAIVVAINQAEDRDAEYTPWVNEDNPEAHGEQYAKWLATVLKPWIDHHYRTQSDREQTTIGGISRSGMMAYYILMEHPNVFGQALIQSPAMWVDHDRLLDMEMSEEHLANSKIMVTVGQYEGRIMIPHAEEIYTKFQSLGLTPEQLRFEIIPNEGHWHITWRKSFALAYPWLISR